MIFEGPFKPEASYDALREDLQLDYFAKNYCIFTHTCHLENLNPFKYTAPWKKLI